MVSFVFPLDYLGVSLDAISQIVVQFELVLSDIGTEGSLVLLNAGCIVLQNLVKNNKMCGNIEF